MKADEIAGGSRQQLPYVWVTWLRDYISADKCKWKSWYMSNFRYAKKKEDTSFDLESWTKQHNEMTDKRVKILLRQGYDVRVEEENAFKLSGKTGIVLSGKPDIVALNHDTKEALVIDEKSGRKLPKNRWQVLIYMFALPLVWRSKWKITGEVEYRGDKLTIPLIGAIEWSQIVSGMSALGSSIEPARTPSVGECKYCKILHCPERIEVQNDEAQTTLF